MPDSVSWQAACFAATVSFATLLSFYFNTANDQHRALRHFIFHLLIRGTTRFHESRRIFRISTNRRRVGMGVCSTTLSFFDRGAGFAGKIGKIRLIIFEDDVWVEGFLEVMVGAIGFPGLASARMFLWLSRVRVCFFYSLNPPRRLGDYVVEEIGVA